MTIHQGGLDPYKTCKVCKKDTRGGEESWSTSWRRHVLVALLGEAILVRELLHEALLVHCQCLFIQDRHLLYRLPCAVDSKYNLLMYYPLNIYLAAGALSKLDADTVSSSATLPRIWPSYYEIPTQTNRMLAFSNFRSEDLLNYPISTTEFRRSSCPIRTKAEHVRSSKGSTSWPAESYLSLVRLESRIAAARWETRSMVGC